MEYRGNPDILFTVKATDNAVIAHDKLPQALVSELGHNTPLEREPRQIARPSDQFVRKRHGGCERVLSDVVEDLV
jgi:hypothetical protein